MVGEGPSRGRVEVVEGGAEAGRLVWGARLALGVESVVD